MSFLLQRQVNSIQAEITDLAPQDSPHVTGNVIFNGTVSGIAKAEVGLDQVDNASDINKPVSAATQTALNALIRNHYATGIPVIDEYDNSVRHIFGVAPVQTALYFDPDIPGDLSNNQIQISFDNTLSNLTNYYT